MSNSPMIAFKIKVQIGDGSIMDNVISAHNVFGAVKFIKDEAAKNGWFIAGLLVEPFADRDVVDMAEVAQGVVQ